MASSSGGVRRVPWRVRGPRVRHPQFGVVEGISVFHRARSGTDVRYRATFRHPDRMAAPPNLAEAEALGPGITPLYADAADLVVDVTTPSGEVLAVDDPRLLDLLREGAREGHELSVIRSERALTDCRPFSLFSIQTARQLSEELGVELGTPTIPRQRVRRFAIGCGLRRKRVGGAQAAHRRESGDRGDGPRPPLQDDHAGPGDGPGQPRGHAPRGQRPRRHRRRVRRRRG